MIGMQPELRWSISGKTPAVPGGRRLLVALFFFASSIFLFVDPKIPPIALADESRNAINAIEMYLSGFSLVTTYGFEPDLWNTKPPLLIWLMTASMTVFGPSEWAIRVPSALAALGMLLCTILFVRRVTGSLWLALTSATLLVLSPGFFGEHGARTADFDATLAFFVTAGLQLLFFSIHKAHPDWKSMLAIGGLVAAGALTKTIAAFIPVAGVVVYLLAVGRMGRTLRNAHLYSVAAATAVVPLLAFYALREAADEGYVASVLYNDVAGRFTESLIRPTTPIYYLQELLTGWFAAGPLLIAVPLVFSSLSGRSKLLMVYAVSITVVALAVFSSASNRAVQYALPLFPWLAIMAALTLRYIAGRIATFWRSGQRLQSGMLALIVMILLGQAVYNCADWRYRRFPERDFYPQSSYGDVFAALAGRGITRFTVVDPGYPHLGKMGYQPLLRWNTLIWERKGLAINHVSALSGGEQGLVVTCQPAIFAIWPASASETIGQCAVLWPQGRSRPDPGT